MGGTTQRSEHPTAEPAAVDQLRAGDVFACQWRLDRPIGSGGMSRVFSATHVSGRRDALKILHAHLAFDPAAHVRFLREAEVTARVRHAGAIQVRDHGVGPEGRPFVAMELLRGATLDALWKRANHGLPVRAVLRVIDRVLDVLSACHRLGIVHRDMKPSNVFVTDTGAVRVLDFGIARLPGADDLARAGTALGTPGFMSPEQAAGAWDQVDAASDVFSVGAMLFALISGKRLHDSGDGQQAFAMAATRPAPPLASVCEAPPAVAELVDRALLWDKRRRFADAAEMRTAVRRVLEALGGDVDAALPTTPARQWARHTHTTHGSEPTEVAALTQAFSWMEDALQATAEGTRAMALNAAQQWLVEARSVADKALDIAIFPFGFRTAEHDVWDPAPPIDQVPRRLHAAGVRALRLDPRHDGQASRDVVALLTASMREERAVLAHAAWASSSPELGVVMIRPFTLIEAAHGSDVAAEVVRETTALEEAGTWGALRDVATPSVADDRAFLADRTWAWTQVADGLAEEAAAWGPGWLRVARSFLAGADTESLMSLVRRLANLESSAARNLMQAVATRPWTVAGVLARLELCGDRKAAEPALAELCESSIAADRLAAIETALEYDLRAVAMRVLAAASGPTFSSLPVDEREARLVLVVTLLPRDGQRLTVQLLQRHGVLADESHDATRRVAARVLGRIGSGAEVRRALQAAQAPMWWNSKALRDEAKAACEQLERRLGAAVDA